jgi:hypothetical protein
MDLSNVPINDVEQIAKTIPGALAEPLPRLFANPTFLSFLESGDLRKNAAFYSQPFRPARVPDMDDYGRLRKIAQPFINAMNENWPTEEEFATIRPVLEKLPAMMVEAFESRKGQMLNALRAAKRESEKD